MSAMHGSITKFVAYARLLDGDEKGEAQVFCDRLFQAFGHAGYKEAGATLEGRIRNAVTKRVSFADLVWRPRLILEMKKKKEKLHLHYRQAFDYWINCVPSRPRYVVLCNFDEFHIYDFDKQIDDPVDHVEIEQLPLRYPAFNFLFPVEKTPQFNNDREDVSRKAADQMADLYKTMTRRVRKPVPKPHAQRFVLQSVVSMFAEDIDLLPAGTMKGIADDCKHNKQSSYDLFSGLFAQMDNPVPAHGGRYQGVKYFNGGLFNKVYPIELTDYELELLAGETGAATKNWSKVNPSIFGTLFQDSMEKAERHALGAHYTAEADIQRIVGPTIVRPWQERIDSALTPEDLIALRRELMAFRVLDPACGSGNFLYVSFREIARLDIRLVARLRGMLSARDFKKNLKLLSAISSKQFYGIEIDSFGVELTKVTLMLARKLALDEAAKALSVADGEFTRGQGELAFRGDGALPLDNLDDNIACNDALFCKWPEVDAIVGNPPFQSKNKMQKELSPEYLHRLRARFPNANARADYCTHWFRLAHEHLKPKQRAGLVGTNTIRQNYSREAGLDYVVANGGTITEAVTSMVWPGEANLHVSIVNWVKGEQSGYKRIYLHEGNDPDKGWGYQDVEAIGSSLSLQLDVTKAKVIAANAKIGGCYQGQTHGHKGFLISIPEAQMMIRTDERLTKVVRPYLIAEDLIGTVSGKPSRYAIDFSGLDQLAARKFKAPFERIEKSVLPDRKAAYAEELERNKIALKTNAKAKVNHHHKNFLEKWWLFSYARTSMMEDISKISRYIACGSVTLRPVFDFVSSEISPNAALQVFPYEDDYSFGILQSHAHWIWFTNRCSTLTERYRYTSNTVFDSFPWPQSPSAKSVREVADCAIALRDARNLLKSKHEMSYRELYRSLEAPGKHPMKDLQAALDRAVADAYGMPAGSDLLGPLLALNLAVADAEGRDEAVQGPGLPSFVNDTESYVTGDMIAV